MTLGCFWFCISFCNYAFDGVVLIHYIEHDTTCVLLLVTELVKRFDAIIDQPPARSACCRCCAGDCDPAVVRRFRPKAEIVRVMLRDRQLCNW